jgi:hypothetical protein
MLDSATAAQRWQQSASGAQTRYTEGVQATSVDPTALAAAQASKMLQGVQQAITSGRWQRRLAEVGAAGWKSATLAKANNSSTGIAASGSKYQQGYGQFAAYMQPYQNQINSMPKNSLADSIARATAWIQNAANYKQQA